MIWPESAPEAPSTPTCWTTTARSWTTSSCGGLTQDSFDVMPNASNTDRVRDALSGPPVGTDFRADDVTASRAVLAVQGPEARSRLAAVLPGASEVARNCVAPVDWEGALLTVAGTGYTGEEGVEIAVASAVAEQLWDAVIEAGIVPAGLGARDTLRLEAGLPLHGHELGPGITPLQAGLGWVVRWDKQSFRGREALAAERERGIHRRLRGLRGRGSPPAPGGPSGAAGRRDCGRGHLRQLLAHVGDGHRLGLRAPRRGHWRRADRGYERHPGACLGGQAPVRLDAELAAGLLPDGTVGGDLLDAGGDVGVAGAREVEHQPMVGKVRATCQWHSATCRQGCRRGLGR